MSGHEANLEWQHPPVEYIYSSCHPRLQFLPQILAKGISNYFAEELNVPSRPDTSKPWNVHRHTRHTPVWNAHRQETRHTATNKAVPVMHTGNSCRVVRKGSGQRMDSSKQATRELFVNGLCPSQPAG